MTLLQLKLNTKSTLIWTSLLVGFIVLFMAVYPSMANESMQLLIDGKLEGLPPALLSIVGFDSIPDFTDIRVYYGYIMQYMNIALAIFSLSLGLSSFLQEEIDKTIEFLFAQPISRKELILDKLKANTLIVVTVVTMIILAGTLSFYLYKPNDIQLISLLKDSLPLFLSYYVIAFIFLLLGSGLSLLLKPGSKAVSVSMAIVFSSYFIGIMSEMTEVLLPLKSLSLLHGLFPADLYANDFGGYSVFIWTIISISFFVFGFKKFFTRDILV